MDILDFLSKYGINKTTKFDLLDIAKDLKIKINVVMRDEIPLIKSKPTVINLESSKENGSHLVAYYRSADSGLHPTAPLSTLIHM